AAAPAWGPDELRMLFFGACGALVLGIACYLLFLRAVARFFNRDSLAIGVLCYLAFILLVCASVVLLVTGAFDSVATRPRGDMLLWVGLGILVTVGVGGTVLVGMVRGAITQGLLKS